MVVVLQEEDGDKVKLQSVGVFDAQDVLIPTLSHGCDVFSRSSSPLIVS